MNKINKTKKFVALVLILAITIGSIFASPLNLASAVGNAKLYNNEYKSVNNSNSVEEGWIVRTADHEVNFENKELSLTIGENSLVQVTSLQEASPVIYLLDGWLCAKTTEGVNLTVNTTVTSYTVTSNSTIIVVSNDTTENGYVKEGSASVSNNLTGASNTLEEGKALDLSQSSAQPQAPAEDSEVAVLVAKAEAPVTETPVVEVPETEAATEAEQPAEATQPAEVTTETKQQVALSPLTKTFTYRNYEATITAYVGKAIIEYPTFVTAQEIYTAASAAYNAYSQYLKDVYIEVVEDGKAVVTYPETYGPAEFNFAVAILDKELPYYIASLFVSDATKIKTEAEVNVDYAEPVIVEIVAPETSAEAQEEVEVEATSETTEATTEATTETATETTAEVATPEPVAVAEAPVVKAEKQKKTTNFKFGATLSVLYGQYTEESSFTIIKNTLIGTSPKNAIINIDPYITIGKFTLGLHVSLDINNIKDSFTFNTNKGIPGYINSIAKYIGKISYNSDILKLNIERAQNLEFSSPVFFEEDKAFDNSNNLIVTGSIEYGFLKISGFFDDLQLTNHLNEEAQYAGLSLAAGSKYVTVNASAIAKVKSKDQVDLYPAIDATATISTKKFDIEFYAGFASLYKLNSTVTKNFLGMGKITINTNAFTYSLGAAYNKGLHLNDLISFNTVSPVAKTFEGNSLDVLLSAGLHLGVFSLDSEMSIPLIKSGKTVGLAKNTVTTPNGSEEEISADIMTLNLKLDLTHFVLSGGILYEGFSGKVEEIINAVKNNTNISTALNSLIDQDLAKAYARMDIKFGTFDIYARGDLASINDSPMFAMTFGASFTF